MWRDKGPPHHSTILPILPLSRPSLPRSPAASPYDTGVRSLSSRSRSSAATRILRGWKSRTTTPPRAAHQPVGCVCVGSCFGGRRAASWNCPHPTATLSTPNPLSCSHRRAQQSAHSPAPPQPPAESKVLRPILGHLAKIGLRNAGAVLPTARLSLLARPAPAAIIPSRCPVATRARPVPPPHPSTMSDDVSCQPRRAAPQRAPLRPAPPHCQLTLLPPSPRPCLMPRATLPCAPAGSCW